MYCFTLCGSWELAEDITADAFVKAYLSLPDSIPSFQYWLLRVCRNLWLDHCRREKHLTSPEALDTLSDQRTPETVLLANERQRILWKAIASLSPLDRELVTLHYFSGLPLNGIAALMGKSHAAIRQRMVRLRAALKQRMEEQGYGQS